MKTVSQENDVTMVDIAPSYSAISDHKDHVVNAAVHINFDPDTGQTAFHVYTDDGKGNGDLILSVWAAET